MIILDTNVLSALMQKDPDVAVINWLDRVPAESVWITTITLFEARCGLALLPEGKRRKSLIEIFEKIIVDDLDGRVLLFDQAAAGQAAQLAASRKKTGSTVDMRDTFIAGIALAKRATIVTRNTRHFSDLRVDVINPWERG